MFSVFLLTLALALASQAAPILSPAKSYKVDPTATEPGPPFTALAEGWFDNKMDVRNATPPFSTVNSYQQRIFFRRVEDQGRPDRFELRFEKLKAAEAGKPKADFSRDLAGKVLIATDNGVTNDMGRSPPDLGAENPNRPLLSQLKLKGGSLERLLIFIGDPGLSHEVSFISRKWTCLASLAGKAVGAKWKAPLGPNLNYDCEFAGWARAGGRKVAVVKLEIRAENTLWTGPAQATKSIMKFHRTGLIYYVPDTHEVLQKQKMAFTVDPPLNARKANTASTAHAYAEADPTGDGK